MKTPPIVSVGERWEYPPTSEFITVVEVGTEGPWPIKYTWETGPTGSDDLETFLRDFHPADFKAWMSARDAEHAEAEATAERNLAAANERAASLSARLDEAQARVATLAQHLEERVSADLDFIFDITGDCEAMMAEVERERDMWKRQHAAVLDREEANLKVGLADVMRERATHETVRTTLCTTLGLPSDRGWLDVSVAAGKAVERAERAEAALGEAGMIIRVLVDGGGVPSEVLRPYLEATAANAVPATTPGAPDQELALVVGRAATRLPDFIDGERERDYLQAVGEHVLGAIDAYRTRGERWPRPKKRSGATPGAGTKEPTR